VEAKRVSHVQMCLWSWDGVDGEETLYQAIVHVMIQ
jgi:hypothetical protein